MVSWPSQCQWCMVIWIITVLGVDGDDMGVQVLLMLNALWVDRIVLGGDGDLE